MSEQEITFVDETERELFARARLGESVRAFLRSDVGRYLHGRAKIDLDDAKEELLELNADSWWGRRKFKKAQARATTARTFMRYCADAIQDSEIAYQELTERENRTT